MPKKSKNTKTKKVYATNLENLTNLDAESDIGKELGFNNLFDDKGNLLGKGMGSKLNSHEFLGEIPPPVEGQIYYKDLPVSFDLRMSFDENSKMELLVSKKGRGTYYKFDFENLSEEQASKALFDFEDFEYVIVQALYHYAWACYRKQDTEKDQRILAFEGIIEKYKNFYKRKLSLERFSKTPITEREQDGVSVKEFSIIETGRNPKTSNEILKEKETLLSSVFGAFQKWKTSHTSKPKQTDIARIVFPRYTDNQKKMSEALKFHNLKFSKLLNSFNVNEKISKEDFINLYLPTR